MSSLVLRMRSILALLLMSAGLWMISIWVPYMQIVAFIFLTVGALTLREWLIAPFHLFIYLAGIAFFCIAFSCGWMVFLTAGLRGLSVIAFGAVLSDSLAYIFGRWIGGPLLCPSISPHKTISGSFFSACFTAFALYYIFPKGSLLLALGIPVSAQLGDLIESWAKRTAGIKDMGTILPGHGGVLDRVDSWLFVAVWVWLCL